MKVLVDLYYKIRLRMVITALHDWRVEMLRQRFPNMDQATIKAMAVQTIEDHREAFSNVAAVDGMRDAVAFMSRKIGRSDFN